MLITPVLTSLQCRWIPLGPGYLAAALKSNGHEVILCDRTREISRFSGSLEHLNDRMLRTLREYRPDMVAFSTVSPAIHDTGNCARKIRPEFQGIMIAGGHHATALPELTLERIPELDGVVAGEGEYKVTAIADHGLQAAAPGVLWRHRPGELPADITSVDLDQLPFPDLSIYDMGHYLARNVSTIRGFYVKALSLLTSRGCRFRCGFCSESLTYGYGVRCNSPQYVADMIEHFQHRYEFDAIYFHDNDFLCSRERAEEICDLMIKKDMHRRLKWCIQTRADAVDPGILRLLKRAGCVKIEIGIESGAQEQLNKAGKGVTVDRVSQAIKMCHQAGIQVHGYLIALLPGDSPESLREAINLVRSSRLDSFSLSDLKLYPGTRYYQCYGGNFFEEHNWQDEDIQGFYNTDHVSQISPQQRLRFEGEQVKPLSQRLHRYDLIRNNDPGLILKYLVNRKRFRIPTELWKQSKKPITYCSSDRLLGKRLALIRK